MKLLPTILLLFSICLNSHSGKAFKKKINLFEKGIIQKNKDIARKLQSTDGLSDINDSEYGEESNDINGTDSNNANKSAKIQIISFANFEREEGEIQFSTFFYFLGKKIAKHILLPITIIYSENTQAETSNCTIKDERLIVFEGKGNIIDYKCGTDITSEGEIETIAIDKHSELTLIDKNGDNEKLPFDQVNFNGNSSNESQNIQERTLKVSKVGKLENSEIEFPVQVNYFIINGALDQKRLFSKDEKINFIFLDISNEEKTAQTYTCKIKEIDPKCIIECNTTNNTIYSTIMDMHLSPGFSDSNGLLVIEMKNWENNNTSVLTPPRQNGEKENTTVTEEPKVIDEYTPISTEPKRIDNKTASFQINNFFNYTRHNKKINFISLFYFLRHQIAKFVYFRLRITYFKPLRNLQQENAESVPSKCERIDVNSDNNNENGVIVKFNCEAETITNQKLNKVEINTDIPLLIEYNDGEEEEIVFQDINFNGNSASQSRNLKDIENIARDGTLEDAEVERPLHIDYFKIIGTLKPSDLLTKNEIIPMTILDNTYNVKSPKIYQCTVVELTPKCSIKCDTKNQPLTSTIQELHLSTGVSESKNLLTIKMKDWENNNTPIETKINTEVNPIRSRKKSRSLSPGAIVGVVLACLIVVAAAVFLFAWFMKKSPSLPIKNITENYQFESAEKL